MYGGCMKFIDRLDDKTKIRLAYVLLIGSTIGVFMLSFFIDNYNLSYGVFFALQPIFGICVYISLKLFNICCTNIARMSYEDNF